MNLNVFTATDAIKAIEAIKQETASAREIADESVSTVKAGKAPQVTADDLYSKLLKYIPAPLIGIYLLVTNAIIAAKLQGALNIGLLLGVLSFFLAATIAFLVVRKIKRRSQIAISVLAFLVFAMGAPGVFNYLSWWNPLFATIALAVTAVILAVFPIPPLPSDQADGGTPDPTPESGTPA